MMDRQPLIIDLLAHDGCSAGLECVALLGYLEQRLPRLSPPDDVRMVGQLPHSATGKLLKQVLRDQYKYHFTG